MMKFMGAKKMKENKLLYVPPRGIGDLVFSLPLLHSLRSAMTSATKIEIPIPNRDSLKQTLDLIGLASPCDVFLPTPSEDPLAEERWEASQEGDSIKRYAAEKKIFEKYLAGKFYDLAIVAKPFKINSVIAPQISRKDLENAGFDWRKAHMVDGFLAFATYMGIPALTKFDLNFDKTERVNLRDGRSVEISEPYILFNLGASGDSKKLPAGTYAEVSKWLGQKGFSSILIGTSQEHPEAVEIETLGENIVNLVSQEGLNLDLKNYATLAAQSKGVVGGDSGLLHLADAVGVPVIGLYGPTNPAKFGPYNNLSRVVSRYDSDKDMNNISSDIVISKLEEIV